MKRLIVIEPDSCTREALKAIFSANYEIVFAEEADPLPLENRAALLIIGLDRNGKTAVQLHKLPDHLPVLALSASPCTLSGIEALPKPFNVEEIRSRVARLTDTEEPLPPAPKIQSPEESVCLEEAVNRYERELIIQALEECNGIQTRAAEMLGTTRRILRYRIDKLGIELPDRKQSQPRTCQAASLQ